MAAAAAAASAMAQEAEAKLIARLRAAEAAAAEAAEVERAAMARAAAAEAAAAAAKDAAAAAGASGAETRSRFEALQRHAMALEAEKSSAEERLSAALTREAQLRSQLENSQQELQEKLWDAEERVRSMKEERNELLTRLETAIRANASSQGPKRKGSMACLTLAGGGTANGQSLGVPTDFTGSIDGPGKAASQSGHRVNPEPGTERGPTVGSGDGRNGWLALEQEEELDEMLNGLMRQAPVAMVGTAHEGDGSGDDKTIASGKLILNGVGSGGVASLLSDPTTVARALELLQSRLLAAEAAREGAAEALCTAMQRADAAANGAAEANLLRQQLAETTAKVDFLLELLGERNELIEQLQEDIKEMKDIFWKQLEECVAQLNAAQVDAERLRSAQVQKTSLALLPMPLASSPSSS
ncbi:hypothetical protein Vafri_1669 [Volvox africanus]|nr:hypothetical protein Vafri_1669 [Volvox africanus]